MLRSLYDWCLQMARSRHAVWGLGTISFAESSVFPIPPDVMLIPMALAEPRRAWRYATICTLASVAGGVAGYLIGLLLFDTVGQRVIEFYGYGDKMETLRGYYADWGVWIILIAGITPFPYKLITIASGFAGYNILAFILFSFIARGIRFYAVAFLFYRFGEQARAILEERLTFWFWLFVTLLIGGFALAWYLLR
jgi:membrane protein YqaA with SNARE-associated domain